MSNTGSGGGYQYGSSTARATASRRHADVTPPLPLVRFQLSKDVIAQGPKTINREELRSIPNELLSGETTFAHSKPDKLHDPIVSRRLARWFVARSQKEVNYRQTEMYARYVSEATTPTNPNTTSEDATGTTTSGTAAGSIPPSAPSSSSGPSNFSIARGDMFEYVVYESLLHQESKDERNRRNDRRPTEEQIHILRYQQQQAQHAAAANSASSATAARRKRASTANSEANKSFPTAFPPNKLGTGNNPGPGEAHRPSPLSIVTTGIAISSEPDSGANSDSEQVGAPLTGSTGGGAGACALLNDDDVSVNSINSNSNSETTGTAGVGGLGSRPDSTNTTPTIAYTPSLLFDAEFESGNLERATRVIGRETLLTSRALEHVQEYQIPEDVDQEYDLVIRNDIYTEGNIQWYYFCVSFDPEVVANYQANQQGQQPSQHGSNQPQQGLSYANVTFPMKVRFNIVNMQKKDSLYNYGMKPAVLSIHDNHVHGKDWTHQGSDICYYKNGLNHLQSSSSNKNPDGGSKRKKLSVRNQYTLTFTYTFERPDTVYFAHTFPYTYSDLQRYLQSLEIRLSSCNDNYSKMPNSTCSSGDYFHRRILCDTIAGNRCDVLTITERSEGVLESKSKPAIIVSARVHPGECQSSFMIQGLIDYLCADTPEAYKLRKSFIFTIVPMLNPDGVIHGNYRCSLAGTDLNRRYGDANEAMHPTVIAMREMVRTIKQNRPIAMYIDLHGHSKLKNAFVYGCDITMQPDKITSVLLSNVSEEELNCLRLHCRIFPKILCTVSRASTPSLSAYSTTPSTSFKSSKPNSNNSNTGNQTTNTVNYNGYFSYRDCSFKVQKNKMGTGRVVCWRDIGILNSYTIEASYCGNGDNTEFSVFKKHFDSYYSRHTRGQSNAISGSTSMSTPGSENSSTKDEQDAALNLQTLPLPNGMNSGSCKATPRGAGASTTAASAPAPPFASTNFSSSSPSSSGKRSLFPGIDYYLAKPDLDGAFHDILEGYKSYTHYQKRDLLNMGKHIAQSIYHYANLTHADLAYELEQLRLQNEREIREKERLVYAQQLRLGGASGMRTWSHSLNSSSSGSSIVYGRTPVLLSSTLSASKAARTVEDTVLTSPTHGLKRPSTAGGKLSSPSPSTPTGIAFTTPSPIKTHFGPTLSEDGEGDTAMTPRRKRKDSSGHTPHTSSHATDEGMDGIDLDNDHEDNEGDDDNDDDIEPDPELENENDSGSDSDNEFGIGSGSAKKSSSTGNDDQEPLIYRTTSGSTKYSTASKALAASQAKAAIDEILNKYRPIMQLHSFENNMVSRSLSTYLGVFSIDAIQSTLQSYCNEYTVDRSTKNVGLRIKCELALRRMLKFDLRQLDLSGLIKMEYDLNHPRDDEEEMEIGSNDGSDSNPSIDNQNAAKLLKNLKRFKDTNSLVAALRNALIKKKKKEDLKAKKQEKKMLARLAKQAELARKQQLETERQERLQQAKDAKKKAAAIAAANAEKLKAKSTAKSGNNLAAKSQPPAQMYRLAPEAKVSVPVQIKMMGFKDYDPTATPPKRGTMDPGPSSNTARRQTFSSNTMTMDNMLFASTNPNIANLLGFGGGNNANIVMPKNSGGGTVETLIDLLPSLGLAPESMAGLGNHARDSIGDTPFAAALRLKNAIVHDNEAGTHHSPRLYPSTGSGKYQSSTATTNAPLTVNQQRPQSRANIAHHLPSTNTLGGNPVFTSPDSGTKSKRPTSSPGIRKLSPFTS